MNDTTYAAAAISLLIFVASLVSVEASLSAAIIEIGAGVLAGNVFGLQSAPWMDFLAGFGGILLTFLAGAEVDPQLLRRFSEF
jgi:Kef-type K+ transport system membrane component KefB